MLRVLGALRPALNSCRCQVPGIPAARATGSTGLATAHDDGAHARAHHRCFCELQPSWP